MILLPAIDLHNGQCVRLFQGDYSTAQVVAPDAVSTALRFQEQGAHWLHMVDLDGAKDGVPKNAQPVFDVLDRTDLKVELGGGIRDMAAVSRYLDRGVSRVILGSAALQNPQLVREAVKEYGAKIAVGIDAKNGKAAAEGWLETSEVDYIELARQMEAIGVQYLIFTDISRDGAMSGPNFEMLERLDRAVSCNVIASGGVSSLEDVAALHKMGLYGAIAGRAVYNGALDLSAAVTACQRILGRPKTEAALADELERYFRKAELLPAIVQDDDTEEVLMLAYMDRESLRKTLETGETWFFSRSRQALWHKGETSGHIQHVTDIFADCDDDTLLVRVKQTGAACHTGRHSCFFKRLTGSEGEK